MTDAAGTARRKRQAAHRPPGYGPSSAGDGTEGVSAAMDEHSLKGVVYLMKLSALRLLLLLPKLIWRHDSRRRQQETF